jgi:hypothetical protein
VIKIKKKCAHYQELRFALSVNGTIKDKSEFGGETAKGINCLAFAKTICLGQPVKKVLLSFLFVFFACKRVSNLLLVR